MESGGQPELPPGRVVELPDRGTTFVREMAGPPGAPTVLLLHGWGASADLNWHHAFEALGRRFRVVALDQRGHGQGVRSTEPFRLEQCADDAAALLDVLGIERVVAVGYSMGGPVAKLLWRHHPERVEGLVLCATAGFFTSGLQVPLANVALGGLAAAARRAPEGTQRFITDIWLGRGGREYDDWARELLATHDWPTLVEAMRETSLFSSRSWVSEIDVPTAVIVTVHDETVPSDRQEELRAAIQGAKPFRIDGDHNAAVTAPERFVPVLVTACTWVAERVRATTLTLPEAPPTPA